jgi:hypothetical protein
VGGERYSGSGFMRVVVKGREQKGWAKKFSCTGSGNGDGGCAAILLVEEGDLYQTTSNCRDETTYYTTFKCCECGTQTDVKGVPGHVIAKLVTNNNA